MYLLTEAYERDITVTKSEDVVKLLNHVVSDMIEHNDTYGLYDQVQDSIKNQTQLAIDEDQYGFYINWSNNFFTAWSNGDGNYDMKIELFDKIEQL